MENCQGLAACAIRNSDGVIDVEDTLEALETQLQNLSAEEADRDYRIGAAVQSVFDQWLGKTLTLPSLVNEALRHLEVTPETFTSESAAVADYVRARKDGAFKIAKGKGGGVSRRCDTPPPKA